VTGQAGRPPQGAAYLFQLLIAAQLPLVTLFLATADWTRPARPLLALAGAAAMGALYWARY
jgi:hypothetical protein